MQTEGGTQFVCPAFSSRNLQDKGHSYSQLGPNNEQKTMQDVYKATRPSLFVSLERRAAETTPLRLLLPIAIPILPGLPFPRQSSLPSP